MGGPGGGSKISWDGLEYRDIAAFTGPMQKKDVSVGDVGKNCSSHASHGNVGDDIDKTSFPSFTVCMLRFFTRCNIGLAPPVLGSSFSTLFGIIHSLYRQRGKDSYFLVGTLGVHCPVKFICKLQGEPGEGGAAEVCTRSFWSQQASLEV